MPKDYTHMRDEFYQEKIDAWRARNPNGKFTAEVRKKLYDAAQAKAAKIHNANHPGNPMGGKGMM